MKYKLYIIVDWNGKVIKIFLTKLTAKNWINRYKKGLSKLNEMIYWYFGGYKIVESEELLKVSGYPQ